MGFLDNIKQGAGRAAFEADRRLRLARVESNLAALQGTLKGQLTQLGEATYDIYKRQALADPGLAALCDQVRATERQVERVRAEVEAIRLEAAPAATTLLFGRVCLSCRIKLPQEAVFCPRCGGPATDVAPPAVMAGKSCPACGKPVAPEARFCPVCGADTAVGVAASVTASAAATVGAGPVAQPAGEIKCSGCGTALPADAVFCSECGTEVTN